MSTLPSHVDSTGLMLPEADMLMILLRSLPPRLGITASTTQVVKRSKPINRRRNGGKSSNVCFKKFMVVKARRFIN